jgi:hypothetical protein
MKSSGKIHGSTLNAVLARLGLVVNKTLLKKV